VKKTEAARVARLSRKTGKAGWAPTNEATHTATGTNRVVLGPRATGEGAAEGGREEKAVAEEEEVTGEAGDVMMTEAKISTTTVTETEAGALATND
jgi:hypothetical protein